MQKSEQAPSHVQDIQPGRLVRNGLWLGGGEISARLIGLGLAVYLARVLGTEGYGLIGSALAFVSYFAIFVAAGVDFHGVRDIAQYPEKLPTIVGHAVGARLLLLLISLLLLALLVFILPSKIVGRVDLVLIYALTLITFTFNTAWALRGLQQMRVIALGLILQNLLMAVATVFLVRSPQPDLWLVPAIQVISECLLIAGYYRFLRTRFDRIDLVLNWRHLLPTLRETLHLSLGRFPRIFYYQGDILLLAWLASAANAGEFLASHKIILSFITISLIYQMNAYPLTSQLAKTNPVSALRFQMNSMRYGLILMMPLLVLGAAFALPLILLIYGSAFAASAPIFSWMLFTVPVFAAGFAMQDVLTTTRKNTSVAIANLTAMTVHILIGIVIIPGHGGTGAALASLAGEFVGLLLLSFFVWRSIGCFPYTLRMLAPIVGGMLMYAVIQSAYQWSFPIKILLGLLSYGIVTALLRAMTWHEINRVWRFLRRLA